MFLSVGIIKWTADGTRHSMRLRVHCRVWSALQQAAASSHSFPYTMLSSKSHSVIGAPVNFACSRAFSASLNFPSSRSSKPRCNCISPLAGSRLAAFCSSPSRGSFFSPGNPDVCRSQAGFQIGWIIDQMHDHSFAGPVVGSPFPSASSPRPNQEFAQRGLSFTDCSKTASASSLRCALSRK